MASLLRRLYYRFFAYFYRALFPLTIFAATGRLSLPASPDATLYIPSRDAGRRIKTTTYSPPSSSQGQSKPLPVLINSHGSGFILPFRQSDDVFCRHVSLRGGCFVIDLQYRLAPENPFPAALHDLEDVIAWVLTQPLRFDVTRISLSGFSAGAALSLAVCAGGTFRAGVVKSIATFYGACDVSGDLAAKKAPESVGKEFPVSALNLFVSCYTGLDESLRKDIRVSPALAPLDCFPDKILVITGSQDSLAPEMEELAARLKMVKGEGIVAKRMDGCHHGFDKKPLNDIQVKARDEAYDMAVKMLLSV